MHKKWICCLVAVCMIGFVDAAQLTSYRGGIDEKHGTNSDGFDRHLGAGRGASIGATELIKTLDLLEQGKVHDAYSKYCCYVSADNVERSKSGEQLFNNVLRFCLRANPQYLLTATGDNPALFPLYEPRHLSLIQRVSASIQIMGGKPALLNTLEVVAQAEQLAPDKLKSQLRRFYAAELLIECRSAKGLQIILNTGLVAGRMGKVIYGWNLLYHTHDCAKNAWKKDDCIRPKKIKKARRAMVRALADAGVNWSDIRWLIDYKKQAAIGWTVSIGGWGLVLGALCCSVHSYGSEHAHPVKIDIGPFPCWLESSSF